MRPRFIVNAIALLAIVLPRLGLTDQCEPTLTFAENGSIEQWAACRRGVAQPIVSSAGDRFEVSIHTRENSGYRSVQWTGARILSGEQSESFGVLDDRLLIRRSIKLLTDDQIVVGIEVINQSLNPVEIHNVSLALGASPTSPITDRHTLADKVYAINKAVTRNDDMQWRAYDENAASSVIALQSRQLVIAVEASIRGYMSFVSELSTVSQLTQWQVSHEVGSLAPGDHWKLEHRVAVLPTSSSALEGAGYGGLLYSALWPPLAKLSQLIENIVARIGQLTGTIGGSVILFAILIRIVTSPVTYWAHRQQERFKKIQAAMSEPLAEIQRNFSGAEQSERILRTYKEFGISPFSGLRGSVGLLIQIPFLLAFFQVTTFSDLFFNVSFLWIDDLSVADSLVSLPIFVPMMGDELNLLPILLLLVNGVSIHKEVTNSGRSPVGMIVFTILIVLVVYSFCAAVVLYWLIVNVAQLVERGIFARLEVTSNGRMASVG